MTLPILIVGISSCHQWVIIVVVTQMQPARGEKPFTVRKLDEFGYEPCLDLLKDGVDSQDDKLA
jgi:hypothetical protein